MRPLDIAGTWWGICSMDCWYIVYLILCVCVYVCVCFFNYAPHIWSPQRRMGDVWASDFINVVNWILGIQPKIRHPSTHTYTHTNGHIQYNNFIVTEGCNNCNRNTKKITFSVFACVDPAGWSQHTCLWPIPEMCYSCLVHWPFCSVDANPKLAWVALTWFST